MRYRLFVAGFIAVMALVGCSTPSANNHQPIPNNSARGVGHPASGVRPLASGIAGLDPGLRLPASGVRAAGWGIDAVLTGHVDAEERAKYLSLLAPTGVRVLRERGPNPALAELKSAGHTVVAFAFLPNAPKVQQVGNVLPEDLLAVFEGGRQLAEQYAGQVDAWEMVGEPDVGYCPDLPDRLAAFQKAMYLGIRAGARTPDAGRQTPVVGGRAPDARSRIPDDGGQTPEGGGQGTDARRQTPDTRGQSSDARSRTPDDGVGIGTSTDDLEPASGLRLPASELPASGLRSLASDLASGVRRPASDARAQLVLMGALALPPGPWLQRAAANGLLEYTDAYNFHFYGHAQDLTGVIAAHSKVAHSSDGGTSGVRRPASGIRPLASGLRPPVSGVRPPPSGLRHPASGVRHPASEGERSRPLPLWLTEVGINAVPGADFLNPARRKLQADFTLSTARQALQAKDVAVFMPFLLVHKGDPHAMTLSASEPLPAWDAYARFTRENPWPARALANPPAEPNPVVVQWMPDNGTTIPHKVSGSYRFRRTEAGRRRPEDGSEAGRQMPEAGSQAGGRMPEAGRRTTDTLPMQGHIRVYNFSDTAIRGVLRAPVVAGVAQDVATETTLVVGPRAVQSVPVTFRVTAAGYHRVDWRAEFVDERGGVSPVMFALERMPRAEDFTIVPLSLRPSSRQPKQRMYPEDEVTARGKVWLAMNGVEVGERDSFLVPGDSGIRRDGNPPTNGPNNQQRVTSNNRLRISMSEIKSDPLRPRYASARVAGLPNSGFIRLTLDQPMSRDFAIVVDLLDRKGQRYAIWENFGASYYDAKATEFWLNLADFHPYFWGRTQPDPSFHPEDVEEIQLRFFIRKANETRDVTIDLARPRS